MTISISCHWDERCPIMFLRRTLTFCAFSLTRTRFRISISHSSLIWPPSPNFISSPLRLLFPSTPISCPCYLYYSPFPISSTHVSQLILPPNTFLTNLRQRLLRLSRQAIPAVFQHTWSRRICEDVICFLHISTFNTQNRSRSINEDFSQGTSQVDLVG